MLAEHLVNLVAEAVLAVFGVVGKLLALEFYEVEEVRRVNICKGVGLVKARTHAHHVQVDDPIIDVLVELAYRKVKSVCIDGVAIVAIRLKTNRLTEVLHDACDSDLSAIGNAAAVISTKPIWLSLKQLPIALGE